MLLLIPIGIGFLNTYMFGPTQSKVGEFLSSFNGFPPRQKPVSFNLDEVMRKMTEQGGSK